MNKITVRFHSFFCCDTELLRCFLRMKKITFALVAFLTCLMLVLYSWYTNGVNLILMFWYPITLFIGVWGYKILFNFGSEHKMKIYDVSKIIMPYFLFCICIQFVLHLFMMPKNILMLVTIILQLWNVFLFCKMSMFLVDKAQGKFYFTVMINFVLLLLNYLI